MSGRAAIGAAPLVSGMVLAGGSLRHLVSSGPAPWAVAGLVGGVAAVLVGAGTLLERGGFEPAPDEPTRRRALALAGIAALSFGVGILLTVV